jgi:carbon storage regulator
MTERHEDPDGDARFVVERRPSEAIVIGNEIEIVLLEVMANHVRLGIKTPDGVSVVRSELGPIDT